MLQAFNVVTLPGDRVGGDKIDDYDYDDDDHTDFKMWQDSLYIMRCALSKRRIWKTLNHSFTEIHRNQRKSRGNAMFIANQIW